MSADVNRPCYNRRPIGSIEALANTLGISVGKLMWVTSRSDTLYKGPKLQQKKDGGMREVFDTARPLKKIQRRIKQRILEQVLYPLFLQGGIKDRVNPRDYVRNARLHAGAKLIINEDIASFFPSVTANQVRDVWQRLFHFPPLVADCLTRLTTYKGTLPQGASTSSYLANLVLQGWI